MSLDGAGIDHSKFGTGYQTEAQRTGKFVLDDDAVRYDTTNGAGGAVPVRDYDGVWPPWKDQVGRQEQNMAASGSKGTSDAGLGKGSAAASTSTNAEASSSRRPDWMCRVVKQCSPCDHKELHFPYCQPYGNKVTIECRQIDVVPAAKSQGQPAEGASGSNKLAEAAKANAAAKEKSIPKEAGQAAQGTSKRRRGCRTWHRRLLAGTDNARREVGDDSEDWAIWHGARDNQGRPLLFVDDITRSLARRRTDADIEASSPLAARQETYVSSYAFRGYQICGRSHAKEAGDYAEFVGINLLLSLAALYILLMRQRDLARRHQSMLARRIGRT